MEEVGLTRVAGTVCSLAAFLLLHGSAWGATVTMLAPPTTVREYAGTIVFSQFDPATKLWYLAVRRTGAGTVERLPVPPSATPFEADIGPDTQGRPELIYQRCGGT